MQNQSNAETKVTTSNVIRPEEIDYVFDFGNGPYVNDEHKDQINIWLKDGSVIKAKVYERVK